MKAAENIGIKATHIALPTCTNQNEVKVWIIIIVLQLFIDFVFSLAHFQLLRTINHLNLDSGVHGVIVQMPLDSVNSINSTLIADSVFPTKDVDGLNTKNQGKVAVGDLATGFLPCTPSGCLELIKRYFKNRFASLQTNFNWPLCVQVGCNDWGQSCCRNWAKQDCWNSGCWTSQVARRNSNNLSFKIQKSTKSGKSIFDCLLCHSNLILSCVITTQIAGADILVVGVGHPHLVKGDWIKQGAVVIDCGINSIPGKT